MVMVPARIAALLERGTDISALRVRSRGVDPEASAVLEDIRLAAMSWSPASDFALTQSEGDGARKVAGCSEQWMTTGQVARQLGLSPQAVRNAIRAGRLRATQVDGNRFQVSREDFEHYRAIRSGT
jgi:excisionase family DNA binding protein